VNEKSAKDFLEKLAQKHESEGRISTASIIRRAISYKSKPARPERENGSTEIPAGAEVIQ